MADLFPIMAVHAAVDMEDAIGVIGSTGIQGIVEHFQGWDLVDIAIHKPIDIDLHPIWHAGGEFLDAVISIITGIYVPFTIYSNVASIFKLG